VAAVAGLAAALPELHPADVLVPAALERLSLLETSCIASVLTAFGVIPGGALRAEGLQRPEWQAAVSANEAGEHRSAAPVLVLQGDDDVLVRPAASVEYQQRACASGSSVQLKRYPGVDQGVVLDHALGDALDWSSARLDRKPIAAQDVC
jgi:acetyl esterase/lipase